MKKRQDLREHRRKSCGAARAHLVACKRFDIVTKIIGSLGVLPALKDDVEFGLAIIVAEVDVGQVEHVLCWVRKGRNLHAELAEVLIDFADSAIEASLSLREERDLLEQLKRLGRGLVDACNDDQLP